MAYGFRDEDNAEQNILTFFFIICFCPVTFLCMLKNGPKKMILDVNDIEVIVFNTGFCLFLEVI